MNEEIYATNRRISREGLSDDFMKEAWENVQEKIFGKMELYGPGGALGTHEKMTTTWCFGAVFGRGGLDLKTRALLILAALIVMPREDLVRIWTNACLNLGWTEEEIRELVIWTGQFGGFPTMRVAGLMMLDIFNKRRADPGLKITPVYLPWA